MYGCVHCVCMCVYVCALCVYVCALCVCVYVCALCVCVYVCVCVHVYVWVSDQHNNDTLSMGVGVVWMGRRRIGIGGEDMPGWGGGYAWMGRRICLDGEEDMPGWGGGYGWMGRRDWLTIGMTSLSSPISSVQNQPFSGAQRAS